jgi:hypothetical protein
MSVIKALDGKPWVLKSGVEHDHDIVGVELVHYYECDMADATPWSRGDSMPDRPTTGLGSTAFVTHVARRNLKDRKTDLIEVIGFEPEVWA